MNDYTWLSIREIFTGKQYANIMVKLNWSPEFLVDLGNAGLLGNGFRKCVAKGCIEVCTIHLNKLIQYRNDLLELQKVQLE